MEAAVFAMVEAVSGYTGGAQEHCRQGRPIKFSGSKKAAFQSSVLESPLGGH
jgi:hypothetical protein